MVQKINKRLRMNLKLNSCFEIRLLSFWIWGMLLLGSVNSYALKQKDKPSWKVIKDGIYEAKVADVVMTVNANLGARIISFRLKDLEILSTPAVNPENYGSTFWLSPQIWKWPPSPVLDTESYQVNVKKEVLSLTSGSDVQSGCQMSKTIVANSADSSFSITYRIINISGKDKPVAPWEVTRVLAGGLTFFPIGPPGGLSKSNLITEDINGVCWFEYQPELVTGHQKLFRNGAEGWLAHCNHGLIFIKQFPDIGVEQEAPHETEVEIYTNKDRTYIELENQGAYQILHPGDALSMKVTWYLRKLPPNVGLKRGNSDLTDFVRKTIR